MRNIKGYNPKTVNHHLSSLRSYNDWFIESGQQTETVVLKNDFLKIQVQYASPCTVMKKDVEAFRQRLLESGNKRDYAIVTLYAYSGIRRSECVNLKLDQVDLTAKEIRVIGKGNKQRLVYLNDRIVNALREYLNGTMLQNLMGYKSQAFYDEHPIGQLITSEGNYKVEFFAGYVASVEDDAWPTVFISNEEFSQWLTAARNRSMFSSAINPAEGDHIITLSTCSYEFYNARFVVLGKIAQK